MESTSIVLPKSRRNYAKVSLQKRKDLVQLVLTGQPIATVCQQIGIKYSTAKLIVKRYKETRTFYESQQMRSERLKREEKQSEESMELPLPQGRNSQVLRPQPVKLRPQVDGLTGLMAPVAKVGHCLMPPMIPGSCYYHPAWWMPSS